MYIKRYLFDQLQMHLDPPEITIITGPRQAGKTTLLLKLKELLDKKGEKTLFLNFDLDSDRPFFADQTALVSRIKLQLGISRGYIFLDEIQRKENAGLFLKGLYDMNLPYKFIVTGSGSLELKEEIHESLPGRKRLFSLSTVSFSEFLNFRTGYEFEGRENQFLELDGQKSREILNEYLSFGGYPKVILAQTISEKKAAINDIFQSFLDRDISVFLRVEKSDDLSKLFRLLAFQQGQLINYSELAGSLGISLPTVKKFLWYLEKTFMFERVYPFTRRRKEIIKSPVGYFIDLGMVNYARNTFGQDWDKTINSGMVFQNFIYLMLKESLKMPVSSVNYWRTKDGAEVDFILEKDLQPIPVEVKSGEIKSVFLTKSLKSFLRRYNPPEAFIIHTGRRMEMDYGKTRVHFLPYYEISRSIPI